MGKNKEIRGKDGKISSKTNGLNGPNGPNGLNGPDGAGGPNKVMAEAEGCAAAEGLTLEEATKKLENLRRTIRKLLNEQGKYRKELTYQVEVAASTLMAWRKVRDEAITVRSIVLRETSREGDERWKAHPIFEMYAKMTDVLRRDLRALQMNKEREKALEDDGEGGDGLTELMAALGEE